MLKKYILVFILSIAAAPLFTLCLNALLIACLFKDPLSKKGLKGLKETHGDITFYNTRPIKGFYLHTFAIKFT